jgi:hypothetical protein
VLASVRPAPVGTSPASATLSNPATTALAAVGSESHSGLGIGGRPASSYAPVEDRDQEVSRRHSWAVLLTLSGLLGACGDLATTHSSTTMSVSRTVSPPPGILSRAAILTRYPAPGPGVWAETKLVSLAALTADDSDLTQCESRGCEPGQLVWLIMYRSPDNRFAQSSMGLQASPVPQGPSFSMFPVNAMTGVGRGDSVSGPGAAPSYWGKVIDLAGP